jgi:Ca2+-binding RTX toxin-like protein
VVFGGQGSSATVGTSGADALDGDSSANQLVAGLGDDTLVGNGGADVLRGGGGDDVLAISDANFASLDGGLGIDTLRLDAALSLDFSSVDNIKLQSIERIDLTADGGNSQVTMNLTDVLNLSENSNVLSVFGDTGDVVNLSNTSNGQSGSWSFTNTGGVDSYVFNSGGDVLATVLIDDVVTTTVI